MPKPATNDPSDEELVRAIARAEQEALRKLNERYGHALAPLTERILNDKSDSEEVAAVCCGRFGGKQSPLTGSVDRSGRG